MEGERGGDGEGGREAGRQGGREAERQGGRGGRGQGVLFGDRFYAIPLGKISMQ